MVLTQRMAFQGRAVLFAFWRQVAAYERNGGSLLEDIRQQPFPILMKVMLLITLITLMMIPGVMFHLAGS
jgi:hypothetical protein